MLTTPDGERNEIDHTFPFLLPGARGVLFTVASTDRRSAEVALLDLNTGARKTIVRGGAHAEYVDSSEGSRRAGYLIYVADRDLRAIRFDALNLEVRSDPIAVVGGVMVKASGAANYTASRSGTLVYMPEGAVAPTPVTSLVWVDRDGREQPLGAPSQAYGPPRISPDETRVVVGFPHQDNTELSIWDLGTRRSRRVTFSPGMDGLPVWTPDGERIVFMSVRSGTLNWYSIAADGTGAVERLTTSSINQWPTAVSPDGTRVFGFELGSTLVRRIIVANLFVAANERSSAASESAQALFEGQFPDLSPDGRYMAYQSDESGSFEIYVRPFPHVDNGRWQVTTGGGTRAVWARNGRELFYLDASNTLTGVPVRTTGSTFVVAGPHSKILDNKYAQPNPARHYDVSRDGRRFLMLKERATDVTATPASLIVVQHWFEDLDVRMP